MTQTADKPLLGLLLMLGFCLFAPLADGMAKLIGDRLPLLQVVAVRFAAQAVLLVPLAWYLALSLWPSRRLAWLLALRTVLHISGIALIFLALRYLPLADAIAIAYVMPFILLLLGHLILGEQVGGRRLAACAVGFGGTLLVMQPSFSQVGWVAALPLAVAVIFSLFMLITRALARQMDPIALQAAGGLMGSAVLLPLLILADGTGVREVDAIWPTAELGLLLLAVGLLGTLAHLLLTFALRQAPAATLAPVQYAEIPIAAVVGWLLFSDFPNRLALVGIAIVVLSGVYIIWRERQVNVPPLPPTPSAAG